jgi:hypothetical protein
MADKELEVRKVGEEEFKLLPVTLDLIGSKIYPSLVQMIDEEEICLKVYEIL